MDVPLPSPLPAVPSGVQRSTLCTQSPTRVTLHYITRITRTLALGGAMRDVTIGDRHVSDAVRDAPSDRPAS